VKIRSGFVSNSSSASFIIKISDITTEQFEEFKKRLVDIKNIPLIELSGTIYCENDGWNIIVMDGEIYGATWCNNDEIWKLFEELNIPKDKVDLHNDDEYEWQDDDMLGKMELAEDEISEAIDEETDIERKNYTFHRED
jgi:hypothetical protein